MSIMGYPKGYPLPPPRGGGGGKGLSFIIARLRLRRQHFSQKKNRIFSKDFSRLRASSVIETLQKKVKKYLKKD